MKKKTPQFTTSMFTALALCLAISAHAAGDDNKYEGCKGFNIPHRGGSKNFKDVLGRSDSRIKQICERGLKNNQTRFDYIHQCAWETNNRALPHLTALTEDTQKICKESQKHLANTNEVCKTYNGNVAKSTKTVSGEKGGFENQEDIGLKDAADVQSQQGMDDDKWRGQEQSFRELAGKYNKGKTVMSRLSDDSGKVRDEFNKTLPEQETNSDHTELPPKMKGALDKAIAELRDSDSKKKGRACVRRSMQYLKEYKNVMENQFLPNVRMASKAVGALSNESKKAEAAYAQKEAQLLAEADKIKDIKAQRLANGQGSHLGWKETPQDTTPSTMQIPQKEFTTPPQASGKLDKTYASGSYDFSKLNRDQKKVLYDSAYGRMRSTSNEAFIVGYDGQKPSVRQYFPASDVYSKNGGYIVERCFADNRCYLSSQSHKP